MRIWQLRDCLYVKPAENGQQADRGSPSCSPGQGSLGLFELMDVKEAAARILERKTDIMTRRSLHPVLREQIEASALQMF
jgi:hypothetical protein